MKQTYKQFINFTIRDFRNFVVTSCFVRNIVCFTCFLLATFCAFAQSDCESHKDNKAKQIKNNETKIPSAITNLTLGDKINFRDSAGAVINDGTTWDIYENPKDALTAMQSGDTVYIFHSQTYTGKQFVINRNKSNYKIIGVGNPTLTLYANGTNAEIGFDFFTSENVLIENLGFRYITTDTINNDKTLYNLVLSKSKKCNNRRLHYSIRSLWEK